MSFPTEKSRDEPPKKSDGGRAGSYVIVLVPVSSVWLTQPDNVKSIRHKRAKRSDCARADYPVVGEYFTPKRSITTCRNRLRSQNLVMGCRYMIVERRKSLTQPSICILPGRMRPDYLRTVRESARRRSGGWDGCRGRASSSFPGRCPSLGKPTRRLPAGGPGGRAERLRSCPLSR